MRTEIINDIEAILSTHIDMLDHAYLHGLIAGAYKCNIFSESDYAHYFRRIDAAYDETLDDMKQQYETTI